MKVYIKNQLISVGGGSDVLDENYQPIFNVKGKVVTITKKKKIYDVQGNLVYTVRNKYWSLFSHKVLVYDANGDRVATLKKGKFSIGEKYKILDTEDKMSIEGRIFGRTSQIMKNGQPVATVIRDFTVINDAFTLEADEKDIPFFTALVIAFDNIKDKIQERIDT